MICQVCKENNANVHITKIVNGVKQEFNICERCAKEKEGINIGFSSDLSFPSDFSFQNILSGIMDYVNQSNMNTRAVEPKCEVCGTTYSEFKRQGLLGCSECYSTFTSTLNPLIKRVQGNTEHIGKLPKKSGKDIMEKKKLLKLKEELQKAIAEEEYEKAAEIRDKMRELQKGE